MSSSSVVLIIERSSQVRSAIRDSLRGFGDIRDCSNGASARRVARECCARIVIVGDVFGTCSETIELTRHLCADSADRVVLLFPPRSTEELAIGAVKAGVRDYIRNQNFQELAAATRACLQTVAANEGVDPIIGNSPVMLAARAYIRKVALSECQVLITGGTGCGKELAARSVHVQSRRSGKAFVAVNCAAVPDTLLESELFGVERGAYTGAYARREGKMHQADGGTLFLDEIGEMSMCAQAKVLRAVETKKLERLGGSSTETVNIRIVAATNRSLKEMVMLGAFRSDLYFRLAVTEIRLPKLAEHAEDIPMLAAHFIKKMNEQYDAELDGFDGEAMELLQRHSWPGNVRELRNLVEAVSVEKQSGWIGVSDLPEWFHAPKPEGDRSGERSEIVAALESTRWNKSLAAEHLRWSRMTLYRKMEKYGIRTPARA